VKSTARLLVIVSILSTAWFGGPAEAGAHTWDVNEAFMTADGKIWFIELREANGTPGEVGVGGHILSSTLAQFTICINPPTTCNVVSPTSNKMILFGNRAYVELARAQGAALPDQVVNTQSFVNLAGDTLTYNPYDVWSTGAIPSDGLMSRNRLTGDTLNSPRNYAGLVTGSIDAARPSPSVVPDGDGATNPVLVTKIDVDGNDLRVTWDTSICELDGNHQLIYGGKRVQPRGLGGAGLDRHAERERRKRSDLVGHPDEQRRERRRLVGHGKGRERGKRAAGARARRIVGRVWRDHEGRAEHLRELAESQSTLRGGVTRPTSFPSW
jgi:hypothetical protein